MVVPTRPPFALDPVEFRFRALAALTGRSPLGGTRELLMSLLLAARLTDAVSGPHPLPSSVRRARAAAARTWLASLALPASARSLLQRVLDATGADDHGSLATAWEGVLTHVAPSLDPAGKSELQRLASALGASAS